MARRFPNEENDDAQFSFNGRRRRQPTEHDENQCDSQRRPIPVFSRQYANSPNIVTLPTEDEVLSFEVSDSLSSVKLPSKPVVNIQRKLERVLGCVVYGDAELLGLFAKYWGDLAQKEKRKRSPRTSPETQELVTDSEGIILDRCLCIDKTGSYLPHTHYRRIMPSQLGYQVSTRSTADIGMGQYGRVYQAADITRGQFVFAEKVIPTDRFSSNELEILSSIDHRNIVKCYGGIRTTKGIHIFMQFAPGGSVDKLLKGHSGLTSTDCEEVKLEREYWALERYKQVMTAVQYLHVHNIVHCDIKASNVVLSSDRKQCFLADFGEAIRILPGEEFIKLDNVVGTQIYMSPEVIEFQVYNFVSDVWSAACFLLNMLTCEDPWSISCPNLGTYLWVITQRPFKVLEEIPEWLQPITSDILKFSFLDVSERSHATELLMLSERAIQTVTKKYVESVSLSREDNQSSLVEIETVNSTPYESYESLQQQDALESVPERQKQPSGDIGLTPSPEKTLANPLSRQTLSNTTTGDCLNSVPVNEVAAVEMCVTEENAEPIGNTDHSVVQPQQSAVEELNQLLEECHCKEESQRLDPETAALELEKLLNEESDLPDIETDHCPAKNIMAVLQMIRNSS